MQQEIKPQINVGSYVRFDGKYFGSVRSVDNGIAKVISSAGFVYRMPSDLEIVEPELGEGSHVEWMGYHIKRKWDFGDREEIGYVVVRVGCNVMPGATWFRSVADAKKGIAAWILACRIAPKDRILPELENGDGDIFWILMELTK